MVDFSDGSSSTREQATRCQKLFGAVVLAALDDAIADDKKYGNGEQQIARWARSRDGRYVLSCAGIDPSERVVTALMEFVSKGVRTSVALSQEESERRVEQATEEQTKKKQRRKAVSVTKPGTEPLKSRSVVEKKRKKNTAARSGRF